MGLYICERQQDMKLLLRDKTSDYCFGTVLWDKQFTVNYLAISPYKIIK